MEGCTEWLWTRTKAGYGVMVVDGKQVYVHRQAYCDFHNIKLDDIKGRLVRHKCDNPGCCNPDHLELGSIADNMADKVSRNRQSRGSSHGNSKLTDLDVQAIRRLYTGARGEMTRLAEKYGVRPNNISRILSGNRWRHDEVNV